MKHLVSWLKPVPVPFGKHATPGVERRWVSRCGRFEIVSQSYASGRNGYFNQRNYHLTVVATGKRIQCDTFADAKLQADWFVDPNHEAE